MKDSVLNFSSVNEAIERLMDIDPATCGEPTLGRCIGWVKKQESRGVITINKETN